MLKKFLIPIIFLLICVVLFTICLNFTIDDPSELLAYVSDANDIKIGYFDNGLLIREINDTDLNRLLYEFGFHEFGFSPCNKPHDSGRYFLISCDKGDIKLIPAKYTVILEYKDKQWWLKDSCLMDELELLVPDLFVSDIDILSNEAATSLAICEYYSLGANESEYFWWAMACFLSRAHSCMDDVVLENNYLYISDQSAYELSMFLFSDTQTIPDIVEIFDHNGNLLVERTSDGYKIRLQATEGCKMEWKYHSYGELFVGHKSVAIYYFHDYCGLFCSGITLTE